MTRLLEKFVSEKLNYPLLVAEIGVDAGQHAGELLSDLPIKKLYLVDPYTDYWDPSSGSVSAEGLKDRYRYMFVTLKQYFNDFEKIVLVTRTSEFASTLFPDGYFDFVYIDGNHSYDYVKLDIALWWPKVKSGGILGGHDFENIPDVNRAVKEFSSSVKKDLLTFICEDGSNSEWGLIK